MVGKHVVLKKNLQENFMSNKREEKSIVGLLYGTIVKRKRFFYTVVFFYLNPSIQ